MNTPGNDEQKNEKNAAQAQMLENRLVKRLRHLRKWARRIGTEAYRLYDRDIPEIPLVLDLYSDVVSGALYKRPYEKDEAEEAVWIEAMRAAAARAVGINSNNVIIKRREKQRGLAQYEKNSGRGLSRIISEENLRFKVNLTDYLDTGLFLDRRALRRIIREESSGKNVLNLFCYTGSFSVHAAAGGAVSTTSVDVSNTYLNWARENFRLNGYDSALLRQQEYFHGAKPAHSLVRADVKEFLVLAEKAGRKWDFVIIDPPAFSNSALAREDFDLQKDYIFLLETSLGLLAPDGKIWFSSGSRSFKTDASRLETALAERFPGAAVSDIYTKIIDEDFPGRKTPAAFVISRPLIPC